ncbi:hypothetical protein EYF80_051592 [Liparis tanakae]|uniref:Uncharacterized protein n=1 Tax=Liparis tanakae TaxID=230148 RepID=A0A4Z2FCY4_9TELE|nr:hypothetical protein EYF80_051592 [Liparis tanakae]
MGGCPLGWAVPKPAGEVEGRGLNGSTGLDQGYHHLGLTWRASKDGHLSEEYKKIKYCEGLKNIRTDVNREQRLGATCETGARSLGSSQGSREKSKESREKSKESREKSKESSEKSKESREKSKAKEQSKVQGAVKCPRSSPRSREQSNIQ